MVGSRPAFTRFPVFVLSWHECVPGYDGEVKGGGGGALQETGHARKKASKQVIMTYLGPFFSCNKPVKKKTTMVS